MHEFSMKSFIAGIVSAGMGVFSTIILLLTRDIIYSVFATEILKIFTVATMKLDKKQAILSGIFFSLFENTVLMWLNILSDKFIFTILANFIFLTALHVFTFWLYSKAFEEGDRKSRVVVYILSVIFMLIYKFSMIALFAFRMI